MEPAEKGELADAGRYYVCCAKGRAGCGSEYPVSDKMRVMVLMGGMSSEHEVSLSSGRGVVRALAGDRYDPVPVTITREGLWVFPDGETLSIYDATPRIRDLAPDCVFLALHGPYGEDGRIQGFLDLLRIPYTGSGCAASAIAMDKVRAKTLVQAEGIRIAPHIAFGRMTWSAEAAQVIERVATEIGFPCVVKPPLQGSSVGVSIPPDATALRDAVDTALTLDGYVMIEQFVSGIELTCSVLDVEPGKTPRALPVTEICPKTAAFFDYHAKYTPGATEEITPARIDPERAAEIQEIAVHAHHIVGCRGWSRSDFILDEHGPVWIEVNTIPGLTPTSLFPQAAAAVGISYAELIGLFVEAAITAARSAAKAPAYMVS